VLRAVVPSIAAISTATRVDDHDRAAIDEVEVTGDPLRVVDVEFNA
jgi:hypothetical protein